MTLILDLQKWPGKEKDLPIQFTPQSSPGASSDFFPSSDIGFAYYSLRPVGCLIPGNTHIYRLITQEKCLYYEGDCLLRLGML